MRNSVQAQMNEITRAATWLATAALLLFLGKSIGNMGRNMLMPEEAKRLPQTTPPVTVACPICGKVIEIPDYNSTTRSKALKRHIEKEHTSKVGLRPQVLIEGGDPAPPQYRDLAGFINEPLPEYSLMALLPAIEGEAVEKKIDAVMRQLKAGVEGIVDSHQFRLFLTTMSKFHDYSIGNQILIMLQKPEATRVAGFNTWKDLGRWVKAGEKGIAILAPVLPPKATCPQCGARLPKNARFCPKCGETVEIETEVSPRFFKVVHVFENT